MGLCSLVCVICCELAPEWRGMQTYFAYADAAHVNLRTSALNPLPLGHIRTKTALAPFLDSPRGTFNNKFVHWEDHVNGALPCEPCPAPTVATLHLGAESVADCYDPELPFTETAGLECKPGHFPTHLGCSPCPKGTFSDNAIPISRGATCTPCPFGTSTHTEGSSGKSDCNIETDSSAQLERNTGTVLVLVAIVLPLSISLLMCYRFRLAQKRIQELEGFALSLSLSLIVSLSLSPDLSLHLSLSCVYVLHRYPTIHTQTQHTCIHMANKRVLVR
jgi:hypothetical protein